MTKDWDLVQDEIKDLSFNQKRPLEEVMRLMESKYRFQASIRAYRMKLKEWGLMRHRPRKTHRKVKHSGRHRSKQSDHGDGESSDTVESMSVEPQAGEGHEKTGDWQAIVNLVDDTTGTLAEPIHMGLLGQTQNLRSSIETELQKPMQASDISLDMIGAILENNVQDLEKLVVANADRVNDPIGLPFDQPGSRFFTHPALSKMTIRQHPGQTLFDVACGMPSGPVIWMLIAYGAKGTRNPFGTDSALYNAIKNGRTKTVQALLQSGRSDVNGLPGTVSQPLYEAVFWNVPEIVRILISRGARLENSSHSVGGPSLQNALQLCLLNRARFYADTSYREKCHAILRQLIDVGADVHSAPPDPAMRSNFHMFTEPWQDRPYWALEFSETETACFRLFASKGVDLETTFKGCPCGSADQNTFQHQALWHSTPSFAQSLVDSFVCTPLNDGMGLLSEVLGSCPNAKRHPAYTQRDIQVLLGKGVSPNGTGRDNSSPLQVCLSTSPATDVVSRLQVLLAHGADPEARDKNMVQAYVLASEIFQEPLRSEVMSVLVANMSGKYVNQIDDVSYSWSKDHFPIPKTPTYEQVIACTDGKSSFAQDMYYMVPERAQGEFRTAYFTVISGYFLESVDQPAKADFPPTKEEHQTARILSLREFGLPKVKFQQDLMDTILKASSLPDIPGLDDVALLRSPMNSNTTHTTESSSFSSDTTMTTITPAEALLSFQFSMNDPTSFQQWDDDFFIAETLLDLSWDKP
ncbi:Clr5 multi-domain protein [Pyrenophora tritici-repentis]|nr:Clr5 multi-domain protein [Pyrenophora tritici-repentis]